MCLTHFIFSLAQGHGGGRWSGGQEPGSPHQAGRGCVPTSLTVATLHHPQLPVSVPPDARVGAGAFTTQSAKRVGKKLLPESGGSVYYCHVYRDGRRDCLQTEDGHK
ncbi:uncharacterized protein LOC129694215 [Leucoraja erinacea]|uniref:uncharacterized protein LOC129694215 n=1 Tax=Leucoraja erinaceus TaxID=7782 RepID=UPI0024557642|nr:uncharacterized protein LOC129694215 [Leucoraja erinacea]